MKKITVMLLAFALLGTVYGQNWWKGSIKGQGPTVEKTLDVDPFKGVGLQFSGDIYLTQGSTQSVRITGQQNIIDNISTDVNDGYWKIKFKTSVRNHDRVKIYITIPELNRAHISGSGNIMTEGKFSNVGDLSVGVSGSGDLSMDVDARSIVNKISGSGDVELRGSADEIDFAISGSGDIEAYNLKANYCKIRISGSGTAKIHAEENLEVKVSGSGDVYYRGKPKVNSRISGSGDLVSRS